MYTRAARSRSRWPDGVENELPANLPTTREPTARLADRNANRRTTKAEKRTRYPRSLIVGEPFLILNRLTTIADSNGERFAVTHRRGKRRKNRACTTSEK